jgi:hypothetical protein
VTWGDDTPEIPPPPADVFGITVQALSDDRNWKADIPANNNYGVTLRDPGIETTAIVIHPFGNLSVSQKVVPLRYKIDKFGNQLPANVDYFDLTYAAGTSDPVQEEFAIGNYTHLTDDQKLSVPSFEKKDSGLMLNPATTPVTGLSIDKDVVYKLEYLPRQNPISPKILRTSMSSAQFNQTSRNNAIHRSAYSVNKKTNPNASAAVTRKDTSFKVVSTEDLSVVGGMSASTYSEAVQMQMDAVSKDPSLITRTQIIADYELN